MQDEALGVSQNTGRDLTRSTAPTGDVAGPTRDLRQLLEQSVIGITLLISYCFNKFTRVPLRAGGAQPPAPWGLLTALLTSLRGGCEP